MFACSLVKLGAGQLTCSNRLLDSFCHTKAHEISTLIKLCLALTLHHISDIFWEARNASTVEIKSIFYDVVCYAMLACNGSKFFHC